MIERLVTGTVRARQGNRYVVVGPNGERHLVGLEGVETPLIGVDVIGLLTGPEDDARMRLVPDVTRELLKGRARIIPMGRPDLTARMLARLLQGTGPASIRPGTGGMIDRTAGSQDPDIAWALAILGPEASKVGIALNVIDPMALADSAWDDAKLREEVLPADTSGETRALQDLRRLLNDGMAPACSMTITRIGRGAEVPSVDFVMPYSPFATGLSWSADIARAWNNELVTMSVPGADARRLSTFRELALAFVPRHLGRVTGPWAEHVKNAFADVAAAIAFMNFGGSSMSVMRFQRLREAAIARWEPPHDRPPATSEALAALLSTVGQIHVESADDILQLAASIARAHTPASDEEFEALQSRADAAGAFVRLPDVPIQARESLADAYAKDLDETVQRLRGSPRAMSRLAMFGVYSIPEGFEEVFDEVVGPDAPPSMEETFEFADTFAP